jgi:hypothetical protein
MSAVAARVRSLDTTDLLRLGVLGLALLGIVGTTIELVFQQHWSGTTQKIVWPAMIACVVALGLIAFRPTSTRVWVARALCAVVLAIAGLGIVLHVHENMEAAPLDRHYGEVWDSMGTVDQVWAAVTGEVGPAPTLAPGALAEISFALLLATIRMPLPERRPTG